MQRFSGNFEQYFRINFEKKFNFQDFNMTMIKERVTKCEEGMAHGNLHVYQGYLLQGKVKMNRQLFPRQISKTVRLGYKESASRIIGRRGYSFLSLPANR